MEEYIPHPLQPRDYIPEDECGELVNMGAMA
jgi:hypothetical protein